MRSDLIIPIFTASFPTLAVLVGILLNRSESVRLDGSINALESRLNAKIGGIDGRLSGIENRLDARLTALDNRFHSDMDHVISKLTELTVRVARLEEKQTR